MSYALGQAKWVPGQISFSTTRTGRLPNVQPLIEAGLPYAPYIEHGSYARGTPDIARYGRDPYRGLGSEPSRKAMSNTTYRLHCTNWAMIGNGRGGFDGGRDAKGWRRALRSAAGLAREQGVSCRVYTADGRFMLAEAQPSGSVRVLRRAVPWQSGLGDTLTSWACDSEQFAKSWAERVNTGLSVGTQAAVLGAGIAGLLGAVLKRPLLGTAVGAAVGYGTHAIWTAPQRVS